LLLFGAGYPILARWAPREPSALKLVLLASLLSPPIVVLLELAFEPLLAVDSAWSATFAAVAGLQLAGRGRPLSWARPGGASLTALALALGLAGLAALILWQGPAARLEPAESVWHASMAAALERGHPWENPFLAGTPFPCHPGLPLLVRAFARVLGIAEPSALAAVSIWSLVTLVPALYLIAAALWRSPGRDLSALLLALIGWGALGRGVLPGIELCTDLTPQAPALAYGVGAWLAAAHGLRHGERPWLGLCGLLHGLTLLVDPGVGLGALLATAATALLLPGERGLRAPALLSLLAWALPALWVARRFGMASGPEAVAPATVGAGQVALAAAPLLLLAAPLLWRRRVEGRRRTILALALLGALLPALLGWVWPGAVPDRAALFRLSSFPLALLAAGGAAELWAVGRGGRWLAALGVLALLVGGGAAALRSWSSHLDRARGVLRVAVEGGALAPEASGAELLSGDGLLPPRVVPSRGELARAFEIRRGHRARAYRWIRAQGAALGTRPVLVRSLAGDGDRGAGPLEPHLASLYADLPLWCDADARLGKGHPRWEPRREMVRGLFESATGWDPLAMQELQILRRSAVLLVEEADRERTRRRGPERGFRGVDLRLERLGARRVFAEGTVAVYLWEPSRAGGRR